MAQVHKCEVRKIRQLNERYCHLRIFDHSLANEAKPGQFVNIKVAEDGLNDPFLKRPFSIHRVNASDGEVDFLIKVVGIGSQRLCNLSAQKRHLEIIGPLGQGFWLIDSGEALLVGGGIGVAPLAELAHTLVAKGVKVTLLFGINDLKDLVLLEMVQEYSPEIIMVNPGVSGYRQGLVTELVKEKQFQDYQQIYTCGPNGMLMALQKMLGKYNAIAQFSMEEKMGCGVGLCFSCTCQVKKDVSTFKGTGQVITDSEWSYERVCTRGPVFRGNEVILDDLQSR